MCALRQRQLRSLERENLARCIGWYAYCHIHAEGTTKQSCPSVLKVDVSIPQILLDALVHAFVEIGQLGLLIFDEGMLILDNMASFDSRRRC